MLDTFRHAVREPGAPFSTLTDNGIVFTTRFSGGKGGRNTFEPNSSAYGSRRSTPAPNHPTTCGNVERFHQTLKERTPRPAAAGDGVAVMTPMHSAANSTRTQSDHASPMTHTSTHLTRLAALLAVAMALPSCSQGSSAPSTTPAEAPATSTTDRPTATTSSTTSASTNSASTTSASTATTAPAATAATGDPTEFVVSYADTEAPGPVVCAQPPDSCVTSRMSAAALPTTGDWVGTVVSATGNATVGDLVVGNGLIAFNGSVAPCGTGTVLLTVLTVRGPIPTPVPGMEIPFESTPLNIVPGTGTGDLTGLTGSGTASAILTPTFGVDVTYALDVDCGPG